MIIIICYIHQWSHFIRTSRLFSIMKWYSSTPSANAVPKGDHRAVLEVAVFLASWSCVVPSLGRNDYEGRFHHTWVQFIGIFMHNCHYYIFPKSPKTIYLIVVQCKTILWHGVMLSRWITLDHAMGPSIYISCIEELPLIHMMTSNRKDPLRTLVFIFWASITYEALIVALTLVCRGWKRLSK